MARPSASPSRPRGHRHRPERASSSARSARSLVADTAARAFGVLVLVGALATTFGGWFATLR